MGRVSNDSDSQNSSSGNGISKESSLSPATVMGAESAEREARPAMPAGLGPSSAGSSSGSAASSPIRGPGSLEMSGSGSASGKEGTGQRSPAMRSMILEKPPSFKVGAATLYVLVQGMHAKSQHLVIACNFMALTCSHGEKLSQNVFQLLTGLLDAGQESAPRPVHGRQDEQLGLQSPPSRVKSG